MRNESAYENFKKYAHVDPGKASKSKSRMNMTASSMNTYTSSQVHTHGVQPRLLRQNESFLFCEHFNRAENEFTVCSSQGVSIAQLKGADNGLKEFLKPKYTKFFEKTTGTIDCILELLAYIPYNWDERRA